MRATKVYIAVILLFGSQSFISAKIHSKMSERACAQIATHIVVASEDAIIDGHLTVLESWKGDLNPGDKLFIPELAAFNSTLSRAIHCLFFEGCSGSTQEYVSCSRMVLFLQKNSASLEKGGQPTSDAQEWGGVGIRRVSRSIIWIEGERSFAFWDVELFGAGGELADFESSEKGIREKVTAAIEK